MPVILDEADWPNRLSAPVDVVEQVIRPYAGDDLQAWLVARRVSRTGENDAHLITPWSSVPDDAA